jgi:hypothetical protein
MNKQTFTLDENLHSFINELMACIDSSIQNSNIFAIASQLKTQLSEIADNISDDKVDAFNEKLISSFTSITTDDYWKYSLIFGVLAEELYQIEHAKMTFEEECINQNLTEKFEDTSDVLRALGSSVRDSGLNNESDEDSVSQVVEKLLACFFNNIELSIALEEDTDEIEEKISAWVQGFGNPYDFDNEVSDEISEFFKTDAPDIKDIYYESFYPFLNYLYGIDMDEILESGDIDWNEIAGEIGNNLL